MRILALFPLLLTACDPRSGAKLLETGPSDTGLPSEAHLVFTALPSAPLVAGVAATLGIVVLDGEGRPLPLDLSVRVSLDGVVEGMVEVEGGEGELSLTLEGCAAHALEAEAVEPGLAEPAEAVLGVVPEPRLLSHPRVAEPLGPLPDVEVEFLMPEGLEGLLFDLTGEGLPGAVPGAVSEGRVRFSGLSAAAEGRLDLAIRGRDDCALDAPLWSLLVAEDLTVIPAFLPAARVGMPYEQALNEIPDVMEDPPPGLEELGGVLWGVPTESGTWLFESARWTGSGVELLSTRFSALPADDADLPPMPADAYLPGPWPTASVEVLIPSVTVSHGTYRDVRVRVAYPSDGASGLAEGRFPVIAFHHAAHYPATIFDAYTDLHDHWASHGALVASVDSAVNVSGRSQSWQNLVDMSTFQLAAAQALIALDADPSSPFHGHVDPERVVVSGHSRGGGASLISLWRDPTLLGVVVFEPVSPLQTLGQDATDPEGNADRAFPAKPVLVFGAALDLDEPWPLPDISYEQTTGPALLVTLHGANHEDSMDAGTPGAVTSTSTIPRVERHDLDQHYSTAFLLRFGGMGAAGGELAYDAALFLAPAFSSDLSSAGVSVTGRRFVASELLVDDFQGESGVNALGGVNVSEGLLVDANDEPYAEGLRSIGRYTCCGEQVATWARARYLAWSEPEARLQLGLGDSLDLSEDDALLFRVQRDCPPPYDGRCPEMDVDLEVGLLDGGGAEIMVPVSLGLGEFGVAGRFWSTCRLPLDEFPGVDLARVVAVRFDPASLGWEEGGLWLDDLRVE
jgi:hypothetical protein